VFKVQGFTKVTELTPVMSLCTGVNEHSQSPREQKSIVTINTSARLKTNCSENQNGNFKELLSLKEKTAVVIANKSE